MLFDECSTNSFVNYVENTKTPIIAVVLLARIGFSEEGRLQVYSSFNATKVQFKPCIKEVKDIIEGAKDCLSPVVSFLSQNMTPMTSQSSTSSMMHNTPIIDISQIPDQEADTSFLIKCTIIKLDTHYGWLYSGYAKCATKTKDQNGTLYCPTCKKQPESVESKLKIHYAVEDDTGKATVIF